MSTETSSRFPSLEARNLNGKRLSLPAGFGGARNVVLIAFRRWHQSLVDSWFPYLDGLMSTHQDLRAYELPLISSLYSLARRSLTGAWPRPFPTRRCANAPSPSIPTSGGSPRPGHP